MGENILNVTEGSGLKLHTWSKTVGANTVHDEFTLPGEYPLASYTVVVPNVSLTTGSDHLVQVMAGASLNVRIRRIMATQHALATTANIMRVQVLRLTTAGTGGTAITPGKLDTGDAASGATAMSLPTVKGTESTILRQDTARTTQTVSATPSNGWPLFDWDFRGVNTKPLIIAAGTANGIAVKILDGQAAAGANIYIEFVETSFL